MNEHATQTRSGRPPYSTVLTNRATNPNKQEPTHSTHVFPLSRPIITFTNRRPCPLLTFLAPVRRRDADDDAEYETKAATTHSIPQLTQQCSATLIMLTFDASNRPSTRPHILPPPFVHIAHADIDRAQGLVDGCDHDSYERHRRGGGQPKGGNIPRCS